VSLMIDTDLVVSVLLADGWHDVANNSFDFDAYEFHCPRQLGERFYPQPPEVCCTGATWVDGEGRRYYCPATSVLAVRALHRRKY